MTRRRFIAALGGATVAPHAVVFPAALAGRRGLAYFGPAEAQLLAALCDCLIPPDASTPGASALGAVAYIDALLAGGNGDSVDSRRVGHWQPGTASAYGGQHPGALVRSSLAAVARDLALTQERFEALAAPAQRAYLQSLHSGAHPLPEVSAVDFCRLLLQLTVEAVFLGAAESRAPRRLSWSLTAYPGAHIRRTDVV